MLTAVSNLAVWVVALALASDRPLVPDAAAVAAAPPELVRRVQADAYNYFRLVNREWTVRACEMFAADLPGQPIAQLHGDAHLEQYAFTADAWGLDDFDDSARGPAFVDILRFLGSLTLFVQDRGWAVHTERLFDRFFEGYRQGVSNPAFQPPEPEIIRRLLAKTPQRTPAAFLEWADGLMRPLSDVQMQGAVAGMKVFSSALRQELPATPDGYFDIVRAGRLRIGVGSAAVPKVLFRVRGPSADPSDDVVLEAKATRGLEGTACLQQAHGRPTMRVVTGNRQVGRLRHEILAAGPDLPVDELKLQRFHLKDWWLRSWEASYREVARSDYRTVNELAAVVFDSGVQLGAGRIHGTEGAAAAELTAASLASLDALEPRLRTATQTLVGELLAGWREIRRR